MGGFFLQFFPIKASRNQRADLTEQTLGPKNFTDERNALCGELLILCSISNIFACESVMDLVIVVPERRKYKHGRAIAVRVIGAFDNSESVPFINTYIHLIQLMLSLGAYVAIDSWQFPSALPNGFFDIPQTVFASIRFNTCCFKSPKNV
jgi:hypothetical protein